MKRAIMGVSAAAGIALAPFCIPPAQAHADDPCVSITGPAAHQACIDESLRDNPIHRYQGNCQASPLYGQVGQVCRDFWVRKSASNTVTSNFVSENASQPPGRPEGRLLRFASPLPGQRTPRGWQPPAAAKVLTSLLDKLHSASARDRRGRLAVARTLTERGGA